MNITNFQSTDMYLAPDFFNKSFLGEVGTKPAFLNLEKLPLNFSSAPTSTASSSLLGRIGSIHPIIKIVVVVVAVAALIFYFAKDKYAQGQYNMGLKRRYAEKNEEAIPFYKRAAFLGNKHAQNSLGYCYLHGKGIKQDYSQAFHYFQLAAKQDGTANAKNNLGYCYLHGLGVEQNHALAYYYFILAKNGGNIAAHNNLGYCYEKGYGVGVNKDNALECYKLAADRQDANAIKALERLSLKQTT